MFLGVVALGEVGSPIPTRLCFTGVVGCTIADNCLSDDDGTTDETQTLRVEAGACFVCKGVGKVRRVHKPPHPVMLMVPTLEERPTCQGRGEVNGIAGT